MPDSPVGKQISLKGKATYHQITRFDQKKKVYSVTSDNEKEFAELESIAKSLDAKFFITHPYASWEEDSMKN